MILWERRRPPFRTPNQVYPIKVHQVSKSWKWKVMLKSQRQEQEMPNSVLLLECFSLSLFQTTWVRYSLGHRSRLNFLTSRLWLTSFSPPPPPFLLASMLLQKQAKLFLPTPADSFPTFSDLKTLTRMSARRISTKLNPHKFQNPDRSRIQN